MRIKRERLIQLSSTPSWATAQKGMNSWRTQMDFCLSICLSPSGPLRPEICPLRPEICLLRPKICSLRPEICPVRPKICPLRP